MKSLLVLPILILLSCGNNTPCDKHEEYLSPPSNISVFYLDSCEYIKLEHNCIIHKANCRNKEHLKTINQ